MRPIFDTLMVNAVHLGRIGTRTVNGPKMHATESGGRNEDKAQLLKYTFFCVPQTAQQTEKKKI
jgi:hypothetical protein